MKIGRKVPGGGGTTRDKGSELRAARGPWLKASRELGEAGAHPNPWNTNSAGKGKEFLTHWG